MTELLGIWELGDWMGRYLDYVLIGLGAAALVIITISVVSVLRRK